MSSIGATKGIRNTANMDLFHSMSMPLSKLRESECSLSLYVYPERSEILQSKGGSVLSLEILYIYLSYH